MASTNTMLLGAVLMVVTSVFVAYYLPPAKTAIQQREQQQQGANSMKDMERRQHHVTAVKNFIEAMEKGAKVSLANLNIAPNVFEGRNSNSDAADNNEGGSHPSFIGITASRAIAQGETVVELPAQLQFNERTMNPLLRKGLGQLAALDAEIAAALKEPVSREFTTVLSLILQAGQGDKGQWGPWLSTLPGASTVEQMSGLFLTQDEAACLCPFDQKLLGDMVRRRDQLVNFTERLCAVALPAKQQDDAKATPEELVHQLACSTSVGQLSWAFGVFLSRQLPFHGLPSLFPIMETLPYAVDANVRPGAINSNDKGQFVSVSLVAAKDIAPGEALTFRLGIRHPSDVFLTQGYHDRRHVEPMGLILPMLWSAAVRNATGGDGGIQCSVRDETFTIALDGSVHEDLWRCAEMDSVYHTMRQEAADSRKKENEALGGESSHKAAADEPSGADVLQRVGGDASVVIASPQTKQKLRDYVRSEYMLANADGCGLTADCQARSMCRALMQHNAYVQTIVELFAPTEEEEEEKGPASSMPGAATA